MRYTLLGAASVFLGGILKRRCEGQIHVKEGLGWEQAGKKGDQSVQVRAT
jgi:hypothetical protein